MIRLVNQDAGRRWEFVNEGFQVFSWGKTSGGIVWIADIDQSRRGVDVSQHRVKVVRVLLSERDHRDIGAGASSEVSDRAETRQSQDELLAGPKKYRSSHTQNLNGTATHNNLLRLHGVQTSNPSDQGVGGIRVAVHEAQAVSDRDLRSFRGTVGVLVHVQTNRATLLLGVQGLCGSGGDGGLANQRNRGADHCASSYTAKEISAGDEHRVSYQEGSTEFSSTCRSAEIQAPKTRSGEGVPRSV